MSEHRWSGWPGAWCLDCGIEDFMEVAIGISVYEPFTQEWKDTEESKKLQQTAVEYKDCKEPGSNRCNPYIKKGE